MDGFRESLGNTDTANEIVDLWQEYEDASTPEALFVKDLDKFEMIVQALEYEKCKNRTTKKNCRVLTHPFYLTADKKNLQGFFDSTKGKFEHPTVKAWAEALYKEREELWKQ